MLPATFGVFSARFAGDVPFWQSGVKHLCPFGNMTPLWNSDGAQTLQQRALRLYKSPLLTPALCHFNSASGQGGVLDMNTHGLR